VESRPVCAVPPAFAAALIDAEDERARLYKLIRVEVWDGELVLSMYFRLRKQADTLFVEVSFLVLPPLQERFRILERMNAELSWRAFAAEVGAWLLSVPVFAIEALRLLLGILDWPVRALGLRESARKRALRDDPSTDYGCHQSLRSWASSNSYGNYFQKLDKEMFVKTIEGRLLDALQQFLDEKGIDTTDIRARQETILNSGVIVSGNNFQESNVSIARKVQNVFSRPASSASTNLA
jgi:hypothetical protein